MLAVQIDDIHKNHDDTLGHRKLAPLLKCGKEKIRRVMRKYDVHARRKKKKYVYPGKSDKIFDNLANTVIVKLSELNIIYSDIFEFKLADGSRVRGCFTLKKSTRQILSLAFSYTMRSDLVVSTIQRVYNDETQLSIWHTDQGKQYGADKTIDELMRKGFTASMSRAGTPTDNPFAERFVGLFKLAVVERMRYHTLGEFLERAEKWINFYNNVRPHESLGQISPNDYARLHNMKTIPYITNLSVY